MRIPSLLNLDIISSDKRKFFICFGDGQVREVADYNIHSQTKMIEIIFKKGSPQGILIPENVVFGLNSNYRMKAKKYTCMCPTYNSFGNPIPIQENVIGNFVRKIQWLEENLKRKDDFIKSLQYDLYQKNIPTNELVDEVIKRIAAVNEAQRPLRVRYTSPDISPSEAQSFMRGGERGE